MNMKLNTITALSLIAFPVSLTAGTIIVANPGGENNSGIPDRFGDHVIATSAAFDVSNGGTRRIDLTWSVINPLVGTTRWEFHNWTNAGGGSLQLNNSSAALTGNEDPFVRNNVHQLTFTPDAGVVAVVTGFNFTGDTDGDTYQYDWRLVRTSDSSVVTRGQTVKWTTDTSQTNNNAPSVVINYTGARGEELMLQITQSIGSAGNGMNIAIDNMAFGQTIP